MKTKGKRTPVVVIMTAFLFTFLNSYLNSRWISHFHKYETSYLLDPRLMAGSIIFILGLIINIHSDNILLSLRKPNETGYRIPQGGLYALVSSPNYLGEILVWLGWAISTWSLAGLSFFVFTLANLLPRALSTQKWYREHFKDYPSNRKAIFPWLV
jgi:protein-S-isoprenylcysteine O-methyltransferase Ste14